MAWTTTSSPRCSTSTWSGISDKRIKTEYGMSIMDKRIQLARRLKPSGTLTNDHTDNEVQQNVTTPKPKN